MRKTVLALSVLLSLSELAHAANTPAYVVWPRGTIIVDGNDVDESYGEANFPLANQDLVVRRGRHIYTQLQLPSVDTSQDGWHPALWNPFRTALTGAGWVVRNYEDTNPPLAILEYQRN